MSMQKIFSSVMAGLGPAIHEFPCNSRLKAGKVVDARIKSGHDDVGERDLGQ